MIFVRFCVGSTGVSFVASVAGADTLCLKMETTSTGTIVSSDGKEVRFKTDFAGEIKVQWAAIKEVNSDKALYVVTPEKKL